MIRRWNAYGSNLERTSLTWAIPPETVPTASVGLPMAGSQLGNSEFQRLVKGAPNCWQSRVDFNDMERYRGSLSITLHLQCLSTKTEFQPANFNPRCSGCCPVKSLGPSYSRESTLNWQSLKPLCLPSTACQRLCFLRDEVIDSILWDQRS